MKTVYAQMVGRASREPKAGHTPGPVRNQITDEGYNIADSTGNWDICTITARYAPTMEQAKANAKLIEEAFNVATETGRTPRQLADDRAELLVALRLMLDTTRHCDGRPYQSSFDAARAAIAKAEA